MKKIILTGLLIYSFVLVLNAFTLGGPQGNTGSNTDGGRTCGNSTCHNIASTGSVEITTNIPLEGYTPGQTYSVTVSGDQSSSSKYGFQLMIEDQANNSQGTLISGVNSKLVGGYITHENASNNTNGEWSFEWVAPLQGTGSVTFYSTMIAANNGSGSSGDELFTGNILISENIISNVNEEVDKNVRIYPTVVGNSFTVENALGKVVDVYSLNGQLIKKENILSEKQQVNLETNPGVFLVKIGDITKKIVKQ
jgi:hypothetical protein